MLMTTNTEACNNKNISISLLDLPIESLINVASYLRATSRALFTVALAFNHNNTLLRDLNDGIKCSQLSDISGKEWELLDFGEIERDLAHRLRDSDTQALLIVILRLSNCINIKGSCLEPLRGSSVLEQIDLSLVGDNESPKIIPAQAQPISFHHVLPILNSIVESECTQLKHVQFPDISREIVLSRRDPSSLEFKQFITAYNEMWKKRGAVRCSKCNANINASKGTTNIRWMNLFGIQFHTWFTCTRHFCDQCASEVVEDKLEFGRVDGRLCSGVGGLLAEQQMLAFCANCHKYYCADCKRMERCQVGIECDQFVCSACFLKDDHSCYQCRFKMCGECFNERTLGGKINKAYCDFCE